MADHREYRRRRYFDQLKRDHAEWQSDPKWDDAAAEGADPEDQILYTQGVIVTRVDPGRRAELESLLPDGFELDEERFQFGPNIRVYRVPESADVPRIVRDLAPRFGNVADQLGDRIAPEYVFVAQQTVHPAEDPEMGEALPPVEVGDDAPGAGTRIVVIDTGLAADADRPFAPAQVTRADASLDKDALIGTRGPFLGPAAGHGSFISDLIHRVAPGAQVINIKVAGPDGACTEQQIVDGIQRALAFEPHIVNLSLGMHALRISPSRRELLAEAGDDGDPVAVAGIWRGSRWTVPTIMLQAAIEELLQRDIVVVASAGNSNSIDPMYPAAFPGVVSVAAVDCEGRRCSFSNYGDWVRASTRGNHLDAMYVVGEEDPYYESDGRPENFNGWADWAGTSFSAPLVAADIAIAIAQSASTSPLTSTPTLTGAGAVDAVLDPAPDAPDWGCGKLVHPKFP